MRRVIILVISTTVFAISVFAYNYYTAYSTARVYPCIINTNSSAFEEVKLALYDRVPEEIRQSLFDSGLFENSKYVPFEISITDLESKIIGFNHFVFTMKWSKNSTNEKQIVSNIEIKDNIVVNSYRVNE